MNVHEEKIKYAKAILETEDEALLARIGALLEEETTDFWEELTESQKAEINLGIHQIKEGETITLDELMKKLS